MASQSPSPSWAIVYPEPPAVQHPYDPIEALSDIPGVRYAIDLFLASKMIESEEYCRACDEQDERLYFVTMGGLIQGVKAIMSYADEDLLSAIGHAKHGFHVASRYRKSAGFFSSIFSSSTDVIKGMTDLERHAELLYAENLFLKVLLGIVYSGDWLAFIKEALNMRAAVSIYSQLGAFLDDIDAAYDASLDSRSDTTASANGASHRPEDPSVDAHFRSGVYLGNGLCNLVLSLFPGKLATLIELFGYKGDRRLGLDLLMRPGGWDAEGSEPRVGTQGEGVRRVLSDMALLIFHLVLSSFTVEGVDISVAQRIMEWNMKRYPNGVFFLFAAGRLALQRSQPRQAVAYYTQAMKAQSQYRTLHHISFYEIAIARLALWEVGQGCEVAKENGAQDEGEGQVGGSAACWRVLEREATWSKATYTYCLAACLLEDWDTDDDTPAGQNRKAERINEAAELMARVPGLRQKIAGKSIPLEKFVARKARTFVEQKGRLLLPALEAAYILQAIAHAPRVIIARKMLPLVRTALTQLASTASGGEKEEKSESESGKRGMNGYVNGMGVYWDDLCLARFLEAVCLRYIAYPDPDAVLDLEDSEVAIMPAAEAEAGAEQGFRAVFEYGPKIQHDHYLVYYAHFELGRLLACRGEVEGAKAEFELILAGKPLEVEASGRKGKYSMENALHMRTLAALGALLNSPKA